MTTFIIRPKAEGYKNLDQFNSLYATEDGHFEQKMYLYCIYLNWLAWLAAFVK